MSDVVFYVLYGTWARRTPVDVARLFHDYPGTWLRDAVAMQLPNHPWVAALAD